MNPKSQGERKRRLSRRDRGKTQRHRRSGSQQGRNKTIGNTTKVGCPFCMPTLAIRVDKKKALKRELRQIEKNREKR
jgi:hypothetical protein